MTTVTDMFCGAGGSSSGAVWAGAEVKLAINHWKLAIETHNTNHPNTDHVLTDISTSDPRRYPSTDVLLASPECFAAGSLILTSSGLIPIEDVEIGDMVLTHRGRWMPVIETMMSIKDTIIVKGQGHYGIETTNSHPFYVRQQTRKWNNDKRAYDPRIFLDPEWVDAEQLISNTYRWATPVKTDPLPIPLVMGRGFDFTPDFFWMVGRWLGDGSLRIRKSHSEITICCGKHEVAELRKRLDKFQPDHGERSKSGELRWRCREIRTSYLFETAHNGFCTWLLENFGQHAHKKTIPAWALSMPIEWRKSLLDGYLSADGHTNERRARVDSVSKQLILGIRLVAESLGMRTSFGLYTHAAGQIEGRCYPSYDMWMAAWELNGSQRTAFSDELHSWLLVKSISTGRKSVKVYNLSVFEDESYVVDGIVVHNCTNHTLAKGKQRKNINQIDLWGNDKVDPSEERSRATMWDVVRFSEHHRYKMVIVENVVDIRYWALFESWIHAMHALGYDHQAVYFNSQFAPPTPQSRDRVYVVFWQRGIAKPNLDIRPPAHCPLCDKPVLAMQVFKNGNQWGRYKAQYVYICPDCGKPVTPPARPAADIIDWSNMGERIGNRKKPLSPKTMARIQKGLDRFGKQPILVRHYTPGISAPVTEPTGAITTQDHHSLVVPPMIIGYYNNSTSSPVDAPMGTCMATIHHALLIPPSFIMSYYGREDAQSEICAPLPTVTTEKRHALIGFPSEVNAEDCYFRMLNPREIKRAMGFPDDYILLGNQSDQIKQAGNAVTPPAMKMLMSRCMEAL